MSTVKIQIFQFNDSTIKFNNYSINLFSWCSRRNRFYFNIIILYLICSVLTVIFCFYVRIINFWRKIYAQIFYLKENNHRLKIKAIISVATRFLILVRFNDCRKLFELKTIFELSPHFSQPNFEWFYTIKRGAI